MEEVLGVADAEVAGDRADEVGDEAGGGEDTEPLDPEADDDAGGAGELRGEDGEEADGTSTVPPMTATACSCLRSVIDADTASMAASRTVAMMRAISMVIPLVVSC